MRVGNRAHRRAAKTLIFGAPERRSTKQRMLLSYMYELAKGIEQEPTEEQAECFEHALVLHLLLRKGEIESHKGMGVCDLLQGSLEQSLKLLNNYGYQELRKEFEDTFFAHVYPEVYEEFSRELIPQLPEMELLRRHIHDALCMRVASCGKKAHVDSRVKSLYSLYKKMQWKKLAYKDVGDLLGFRIITKHKEDCYEILESIQKTWRIDIMKKKDYIKAPKENGYRALHATMHLGRRYVELQILTKAMEKYNTRGPAAHKLYKREVFQ